MSAKLSGTDRDAADLDPRVQIDGLKEKLAPVDAIRERCREAERRRNGGKR